METFCMENNISNLMKKIPHFLKQRATQWKARSQVSIPSRCIRFYLLQRVQTGCMAHPDSCKMVAGDSFSGGKLAGM
jgi:hypothetical protein